MTNAADNPPYGTAEADCRVGDEVRYQKYQVEHSINIPLN